MPRLAAIVATAAIACVAAPAGANAACSADSCLNIDVGSDPQRREALLTSSLVRSVSIEGGWAGKLALPLRPCEARTDDAMFASMEALRSAITQERAALGDHDRVVEVLYIDVSQEFFPPVQGVCDGKTATASIVLRPYHLRISGDSLADNILSLPRSPLAQPLEGESFLTRVLRSRFGMGYDRAFGNSITGSVRPRLELGKTATLEPALEVRKSMDSPYFKSAGGVQFKARTTSALMPEYRLKLGGERAREPWGDGQRSRNASEFGGGVTLKPLFATQLFLDGTVRRVEDRFTTLNATTAREDKSHDTGGRALVDYLPPVTTGLLRAAVWQSHHHIGAADTNYRQLATRIGYTQEIRLGKPGQSLGFELVGGGGKLWGDAPAGNRYFGGNSPLQFMYDSPLSAAMVEAPRGPLMRSFGEGQAGLNSPAGKTGGRSFWHLNMTLAFPVARWSRPLIPDEQTDMGVTLKQIMNSQVDVSGPAFMERTLMSQGVPGADAHAQAQKAFAEVGPAAHFVINDANIFAIRPLLMVDAAGLSSDQASARWLAIGAGVSVTVVTARFEAGYMQTIAAPSSEKKSGALFARLVFENIFR
ncbi:MAG: hypothetical protein JWL63_3614 [Rhodocyclales bacterium]|nr:hypothetical protein [Rhodocyclales bacterium]